MSEKGYMPTLSKKSQLDVENSAKTCWSLHNSHVTGGLIIDGLFHRSGTLFVTIGGSIVLPMKFGMDHVMTLLVKELLPENMLSTKPCRVLGISSGKELLHALLPSSAYEKTEERRPDSSFKLRRIGDSISITHPQDPNGQITLRPEDLLSTTAGELLLKRHLIAEV
ncbi:hypothetical protein LTR56_025575 [Elasticomyces elasticus]|nr:hypothetical protein LTR56_025575 [Elasticomyces elasticus]